jgi:hypothetical protein
MADQKPGPAGNRQETRPLQITVPKVVFDDLVTLATRSPLGATEHAVAAAIIAREIERMQKAGEYGLKMNVG